MEPSSTFGKEVPFQIFFRAFSTNGLITIFNSLFRAKKTRFSEEVFNRRLLVNVGLLNRETTFVFFIFVANWKEK